MDNNQLSDGRRPPIVLCDNLVKIYKIADLEVVALQGLDLAVAQGEILGIVGASGSGKSSLLNILGGLDRPSAGRVWVDQNDLLKLSEKELNYYRRSKVGFVWQQSARNLIPYLNAIDNVELPMTLAGLSGKQKRERAKTLLEAVGLADRRNHYLPELSGGEQQRVALAVALANSPSLLLADEPTGEVDEATSLVIYDAFRALNKEFGVTILIVSHDPGISRHVDRVVAIRDGKTAAETVRQTTVSSSSEVAAETDASGEFEELIVLDQAGRLQVPKEYLDQFAIRGRVRLEVTDEGILIKPVPHANENVSVEQLSADLAEKEKPGGLAKLLSRFGDRKRK